MKRIVVLSVVALSFCLIASMPEEAPESAVTTETRETTRATVQPGATPKAPVGLTRPLAHVPVGVTHAYRLEHQSTQNAPLALGLQLSGSSTLTAEMTMTGLEPEVPGTYATRLALPAVVAFEMAMTGVNGQTESTRVSLEEARQALYKHAAIATWQADGTPSTLAFSPGASPLFVSVIQGLVLVTQLHLGGHGRSWTTTEVGLHGEYRAVWTGTAGRAFTRTIGAYTRLRAFPDGATSAVAGETRVVLAASGGIESLLRTETLSATAAERRLSLDSRLVLTLGGSARVAVASGATPDGWQRQSAHVLGVSEAARLRALEARVAGLILANVQSAIRLLDGSAPTEATTACLWRAVGLLKLDPTLAAAVGELAADPATSEAGQALALDLLVSAGRREAQAALRQAIASRASQADAASCVTRLALVQNPDPATVSMALGELTSETSTPETRDAAALAVGALADWAGRRGDSERSKELLAALTERLDHATSAADQVTGLRALGNAGGEAILSSVTSQTTHENGEVRAAAALALRDVPPESSAPVLSGLLTDPDADVQHAALTTLFEQSLEEDVQTQVVTTLLDALANGTLSPRLHAKAPELADQRVADPELGVKLAEAIRAATSEPAIRNAASSVIAALTASL